MSFGDTHKSKVRKAVKLYLVGKKWISMKEIMILANCTRYTADKYIIKGNMTAENFIKQEKKKHETRE